MWEGAEKGEQSKKGRRRKKEDGEINPFVYILLKLSIVIVSKTSIYVTFKATIISLAESITFSLDNKKSPKAKLKCLLLTLNNYVSVAVTRSRIFINIFGIKPC